MSDLYKLLAKTTRTDIGCWDWTASTDTHGYGHVRYKGKLRTAHRVIYELWFGRQIPKGLCLCHRCDRPICVNPNHMFVSTRQDNNADKLAKGRQSRISFPGSKNPMSRLTEADVRAIKRAKGVLQKDLAKKYGVDRAHISQIRSGGRWGHIT